MAENFLLRDSGLVGAQAHYWGAKSGTLIGVVGANLSLFGLRNIGVEPLIVSRIAMGFFATTPTTAPQALALQVHKATAYTAIQTGGNTVNPQRKRTNEFQALPSTEAVCVIGNTGSLTGSSFTIVQGEPIDMCMCDLVISGTTGFNYGRSIWEPKGNRVPFALEANEGLIVSFADNAYGAGGLGRLFVGVDTHKS